MVIAMRLHGNTIDGGIELMPSVKVKLQGNNKFLMIAILGIEIGIAQRWIYPIDRFTIFNIGKQKH